VVEVRSSVDPATVLNGEVLESVDRGDMVLACVAEWAGICFFV
jgi:hypothetical protein